MLCLGFLLLHNEVQAQPQHAFRVSFKDKQGSPPLSNPTAFLSQRSLDRRAHQNIALDSTDQPVAPAYLSDALATTGGVLHLTSRWLNHCVILLQDSTDILQLLTKPYVTGVKHIAYFPTGLHGKPSGNNPKFSGENAVAKTTGDAAFYGGTYGQTKVVNGDHLHDHGYKGKGKLIAVIDEGFRHVDTNPAFDSMRNNGRLVDVRNFVYANNDIYNNSSHGTSSFSTMAGYAPGTYVGAAPEAEYALYVTEYPPEEQEIELENMLAATERADSIGADIVTESLGYNIFSNPVYYQFVYADIDGKSSIAAKAANIATTKGMIFIASAGNEGGGGWNHILTPGDADSALTVGSVNEFKAPAGNSGYGPNSSGRRKPDVCMVGNAAAVLSSGVNATYINGTSFATPQLAGWAACLWQSTPSANSYRIRRAIVESAHMYETPDDHSGYGVPDFQRAREILNVDGPATDYILTIGPNPFSSTITLRLKADSGEMEMALIAVDGKRLSTESRTVNKGVHEISLSTTNVPAGVYFLQITNAGKRSVTRMVKYR